MSFNPSPLYLEVVKVAVGDFFEDGAVLLLDDFADLVMQGGAAEKGGVVSSPRRENFAGSIDDGFHVMGACALILCLNVECRSLMFDFGIEA